MTPKRILTLLALSMLICLCSGSLWAGEASRVAIVPFKINADRDLAFLRDGIVDMLTTRLSWEDKVVVIEKEVTKNAASTVTGTVNEKAARQIGTDLGADYVLFGSITIFGESVSLDAKMLDVHGVKPAVAVFSQSQGMDTVIPKVNSFAADINEKVFGRTVSRPRETPSHVASPQAPSSIYSHPERLLGQTVEDQEQTSGLNPNFVVAAGRGGSSGFWKSRNFDENIKGMAVGDVDGDGKQEVVLVSRTKIFVHRHVERRFIKVEEIAGKPNNNYISVDVADINNNGKAEIFVTNLTTSRDSLESFVLEWNGSSFVPISEKQNWYYRVLDSPARGAMLLAQKRGISNAFLKGIHELTWQNGDYESVGKLDLPKKVTTVFGFAMGDIMNDGTEMILMFDEDDYLQILSQSGSKEWKSDEHYGGSLNYVETGSETDAREESEKPRIYLGQRIFVRDLDRDGKQEVIVVKNQGTGSRFFKRFRNYTSSEIADLSWDGLGLAQNWKTRKIHSYVSDFAIADFDNDGQDELVAVVVTKQGVSLLVKAKSAIISYDLDIPKAE